MRCFGHRESTVQPLTFLQTEQVLVFAALLEFVQLLQKLQAAEPLFHASVRDTPAEGSTRPVYKQSFTNQKLVLEIPMAYHEPEDWAVWSYVVLVNKSILLLFDVRVRQIRKLRT